MWSENESFLQMLSSQAWLHSRLAMHTATDKIKHSRLLAALKYPGPWSMWSLFQVKPQTTKIGEIIQKYSNAVSHNKNELLLMKRDSFERQQRQQALMSRCTVFVKSKALCSLGLFIKAFKTFYYKRFKCIQEMWIIKNRLYKCNW